MFECNIFRDIWDKDCTNVVSVSSVLNSIKNGRWKGPVESVRSQTSKKMVSQMKNKLPNVTFSGVFEDERFDKNIVMYNQLMIIDIDKIGPRKLIQLRKELLKNPHTVAFFAGPSKGIKVLFKVDTEAHEHSTYAFLAVEDHFKKFYNVEIDPSGKNLARVCFVSYDPEMHINENFEEFKVDKSVYESTLNHKEGFIPVSYENKYQETSVSTIFERCRKMTNKSKCGTYHKGNRNNYIYVLSCLLSEHGIPFENALTLIAQRYESLDFKEVKTTVDSAYKRTRQAFGSRNNSSNNQIGMFEI